MAWDSENIPQYKRDDEFNQLLQNSFKVWEKIEDISSDKIKIIYETIKNQCLFYDNYHGEFCKPSEVFLFNDRVTRIGINQAEKRDEHFSKLYEYLGIQLIADTKNPEKLINQLQKLSICNVDSQHKTLYRQLVLSLSKQEISSSIKIPLLSDIDNTYIKENEDIWFANRNSKKYRRKFKDIKFVYFDLETSKEFVKKLNVKLFEPKFKLMPESTKDSKGIIKIQNDFKQEIEKQFLPQLFCLADESSHSNYFNKEEAISRWNNLKIGYAIDVWIEISLDGYSKTSGPIKEGYDTEDVDVLFKPLSEDYRQKHKEQIGELIHDLKGTSKDIINHKRFAQFGLVIADGVFRDLTIGPILSFYLSTKDKKVYLSERGIQDNEIKEMTNFIVQSVLDDDRKNELVTKINSILEPNKQLEIFEDLSDYKRYQNCNVKYEACLNEFNKETYINIIKSFIEQYEEYRRLKLRQKIDSLNIDKNLEVLCFIQKGNREYFYSQKASVLGQKFNCFKIEQNIYKLFDIEKQDITEDNYIRYTHYTDELKEVSLIDKINIRSGGISAQSSPKVGDASSNHKDSNQDTEQKNQKRGIGQERIIAYKYAVKLGKLGLKSEYAELVKIAVFENEDSDEQKFKDKTQPNLDAYIDNINPDDSDSEFAKKVINIAHKSNKLDGLGYDLIIPVINNEDKSVERVIKVELKTTTNPDHLEIHLSNNELKRICHFIDKGVEQNDFWQLWLNNEKTPITSEVINEVKKFKEQKSAFYSKDYILRLN